MQLVILHPLTEERGERTILGTVVEINPPVTVVPLHRDLAPSKRNFRIGIERSDIGERVVFVSFRISDLRVIRIARIARPSVIRDVRTAVLDGGGLSALRSEVVARGTNGGRGSSRVNRNANRSSGSVRGDGNLRSGDGRLDAVGANGRLNDRLSFRAPEPDESPRAAGTRSA